MHAEQQQRDGIILPAHRARGIDAGELVKAVLQRARNLTRPSKIAAM